MTTTNKGTVGVLREIANMLEIYAESYAAMARQNRDKPTVNMASVEVDIRQNMKGFVLNRITEVEHAAIQHSEQRETVPAGQEEPYGYCWYTKHMEYRFTRGKPLACHAVIGEIKPVYERPAPPVAATVPEAKADQDHKEALRTEVRLRGHIHMLNDEIESLKEQIAEQYLGKETK